MRVLVACEFSGTVRDAFIAKGHDAWSCDLRQSDGPHFQENCIDVMNNYEWDMMIAHPPCTYLTIAAEWAYSDGPYHQKVKPETLVGKARWEARKKAVDFAELLWNSDIPKICIENPVGVLSSYSKLGEPSQTIMPYHFGDDASKRTCLWLKNLPLLRPTSFVPPRFVGKGQPNLFGEVGTPRWLNQTDSGQNNLSPSDDREAKRSVTYKGIAKAMAEQWG